MNRIIKHLRKRWLSYGFETLVVVVGVLIAFTLNDWNENRKSDKFEQKLKLALYNSIADDIPNVEIAIQQMEKVIQSCQVILDYFEQDIEYQDTLRFRFANANIWWNVDLKRSSYETAKTYGFHFLNDDTTRILLSDLYERHLPYVHKLEQRQQDYFNLNVIPLLTEHFDVIAFKLGFGESIPYDYEILKKDKRYRTILKTTILKRESDIFFINKVLETLLELQERIGKEVNE